jgi:hypothetical protein
MSCKLYAGMPPLTQAEANAVYTAWISFAFADLDQAIEAARRLDHAVPKGNVPWVIESDDGQRLEQRQIRRRYQQP